MVQGSGLRRVVALVASGVMLPFVLAQSRLGAGEPVVLSDEAMGTTFTVTVHGPERELPVAAARAALDEARRIDNLLSNYKPDSEWSAMNREAVNAAFSLSPELFEILAACLEYNRRSEGAFDISVGPLMKAWGFFQGEGAVPTPETLTKALAHVGFSKVRMDRDRRTIAFVEPGVELDPGGIGKGYAVDRMVEVLKTRGIERAFVSAGGSSIFGLGAPPDDERGWPVTIRNPRAPGGVAGHVWLRDQSLSTSGSYEKFFRAGGRVYAHIMDPRTGFPTQGTSSVSVVTPRTIDGEAWTKAYFLNGRDWTARHLLSGSRVLICDDGPTVACEWID
jgi:thiamine biosynthesis lipoprotein